MALASRRCPCVDLLLFIPCEAVSLQPTCPLAAAAQEGVALGWLKRAMHYAFTQTDHEVILAGINDGTTGVCLAVSSTHLLVSNCGDSRAVLWDETNGGADLALSVDHKPSRVAEKRRIEGGSWR